MATRKKIIELAQKISGLDKEFTEHDGEY